jgi:hypothetical protein
VRLKTHHVITIEQPVQVLTTQGDHLVFSLAWPFETRFLQSLLPQAKTASFPIQYLHPVATPIAEDKQLLGKGIAKKRFLDHDRKAVDTLSEVNDIPAQIHRRQVVRWPHHAMPATAFRTVDSEPASMLPENSTDTPFTNRTRHSVAAVSAFNCTR